MESAARAALDHDHERCIGEALDKAGELCGRRGARLTTLRRRVLELVWQSHRAVKAYDLLASLGSADSSAKPPTVYRALDFLIAHGLVHRIESLNAYVGCAQPDGSHDGQFLICSSCGNVSEFGGAAVERAICGEAAKIGFAVKHQTVEVRGLCQRCRRSGTRPAAAGDVP